jgi:hypothetical protein
LERSGRLRENTNLFHANESIQIARPETKRAQR